jgi:hypothetical protein
MGRIAALAATMVLEYSIAVSSCIGVSWQPAVNVAAVRTECTARADSPHITARKEADGVPALARRPCMGPRAVAGSLCA